MEIEVRLALYLYVDCVGTKWRKFLLFSSECQICIYVKGGALFLKVIVGL